MLIQIWCPDRPDRLTEVVLLLLAVSFGVLALIFLLTPVLLFEPIGLSEGSPALWAELRAGYGGHFGTAAIVFGISARRAEFQEPALAIGSLIFLGFVTGRCLSLLMDGVPTHLVAIISLTAEAVVWVIVSLCWRRRRKIRLSGS